MKRTNRFFCCLLALVMLLCLFAQPALAAQEKPLSQLVEQSASYLLKAVPAPKLGSIGGEWAVLGLARSETAVPDSYFENYYASIEKTVREMRGVLSKRKYTEYSRLILALSAIGKDPQNVAGFDLTEPLGDFEKTLTQGINGAIWALIALDSADYPSALRQQYVDKILASQLSDGGWALGGKTPSDPDLTGMALQALAKYQDQPAVKTATETALAAMSKQQTAAGSFPTCESTAQMLVALCELSIPLTDSHFVKGGKTLLDGLCAYRLTDGSFRHVLSGADGNDLMSTEQGLYALVAAARAEAKKSSLYRMQKSAPASSEAFGDIASSSYQTAIETLASKGVINGMGGGRFAPQKTMTRAEFAAIIVRALELTPEIGGSFADVPSEEWFAPYVGAANRSGIVNGTSATTFHPKGTITRQQACAMVARAAKLLELDETKSDNTALSAYPDANTVADWAKQDIAFCVEAGIFPAQKNLSPQAPILREEIAEMLYRLLKAAGKL